MWSYVLVWPCQGLPSYKTCRVCSSLSVCNNIAIIVIIIIISALFSSNLKHTWSTGAQLSASTLSVTLFVSKHFETNHFRSLFLFLSLQVWVLSNGVMGKRSSTKHWLCPFFCLCPATLSSQVPFCLKSCPNVLFHDLTATSFIMF